MAQFYNRVTATVTCEIARFVMIRVPYKNVSSQHFGSHWTVKKDFWINNDFLTPFFRGPQMSHCVMYCSPDPSPLCHADLLISGPPYPVTSHCNRDIYCVGGGSLISNTSHPRKCVVSAPLNFITYDTNNHEQHPHTHEKHHQNHYSEPLAASGHNMVANTPPKVAAWALAPSPATTQVAVAKKNPGTLTLPLAPPATTSSRHCALCATRMRYNWSSVPSSPADRGSSCSPPLRGPFSESFPF